MKVLVVDDELGQLQGLTVGLRSRGYKVLTAANAEGAFEYLDNKANHIDLVLTDYAMPGMDGLKLLEKIRETHDSLPVIMMTAYGKKDLVINALQKRCDSFIEKPFTLDQLIHEIQRLESKIAKHSNFRQFYEIIPRLAHQINNPLMAILGSAELAKLELDDLGSKSIKLCLECIIRSVDTIGRINKEIMGLGRSIQDDMQMVDIRTILRQCLNLFEDLTTLTGVNVEADLGRHDLCISGNKFSLEQLFKNLILNAIDSMDGKYEKLLKVKAAMDESASCIAVSIEDTGCGICEESMGKIFIPYFTGKPHGTGLGLSVVKSVVEKHKGTINVKSQPEKGTAITVNLPCRQHPGSG